MQKNEIYEIEITGTATDGSGIGRADGVVVFVPNAAEGDRAKVKILKVLKNRAYGKIEELVEPSESRCECDCGVFDRCGGCVFRHITYDAEKQIKARRVADAVKRIGKIDMEPQLILASETRDRYRNKAQYPVGAGGEVGFYALHSHRIIECSDCLLQPEEFFGILECVKSWMDSYKISGYDESTGRGLIRHIYIRKGFATGDIMVAIVINGKNLPHAEELVALLKSKLGDSLKCVEYNVNTADTNVIMGEKSVTLYGDGYIEDILCGVRVRISAHSFYQVNRDMAERLYQKAAEYAQPEGKILLDLYCGAGTIGLSMADRAKQVIGVEIVPQAVENAKTNAALNGFDNTEFICADAASAAKKLAERGINADVVILDPPRKGCSAELLKTVAEDFSPERIVYVSCDPATLARDINILTGLGYVLREYTPADLFPGTAHVETVALMTRAD